MWLRGNTGLNQDRLMLTDLVLAILHHLAVVTLIVLLAIEFALLKPGIRPQDLRWVIRADPAYGATAALVIVVGVCRVVWGFKGADYYLSNPWFWAKMASFAAIGLLSIPPTVALLKWRSPARQDAAFVPLEADIARLRPFLHAEVALLALVVAFAAAMARNGAF
jgi:putative membrane protein